MSIMSTLVALALLAVLFVFVAPLFVSKKVTKVPSWDSTGSYDWDVVGESNYQPAIRQLVGNHGAEKCRKQFLVRLIPEQHNKHDKNAVRVDISGKTVGYLPREGAKEFRRMLAPKHGLVETECLGIIVGGHILEDGTRAAYGVWLDLPG